MPRHLIWTISDIAEAIKQQQKNKFDSIVVFDGKRGLGKSTGAIKLAVRFPQFRMRRDIVFSRDHVMENIAQRKHGVIVADEMINVTYNRDFWSEQQKKILKILNMYRDSCNVLIACVPNFADLDKQFRALVKLRINVIRRGLAAIHMPYQSSYSSDPWDIKINERIEQSWLKKKTFKPNYGKLTTFKGMMKYGDLGVRQREKYEKIKAEKRNVIFEGEDEEGKKMKPMGVYDNLYAKIKEGVIENQDVLHKYCMINNLKYSTVITGLSKRAKDEGKRIKEMFTPVNKIETRNSKIDEKDSLGYAPKVPSS